MTVAPVNDIAGTKQSRRPIGLLLVAAPVLLVAWLVIWPIISGIARTVWHPNTEGVTGFNLDTYIFSFRIAIAWII